MLGPFLPGAEAGVYYAPQGGVAFVHPREASPPLSPAEEAEAVERGIIVPVAPGELVDFAIADEAHTFPNGAGVSVSVVIHPDTDAAFGYSGRSNVRGYRAGAGYVVSYPGKRGFPLIVQPRLPASP